MIIRYVRHSEVESYLLLGWCPHPGLDGTHHGDWSTLCVWMCGCEPRVPK